MPTRRQAVAYLRLLMLLPFFVIALIPRGMMLAPTQDGLSKTLVICTAYGIRTITLSEAMGIPVEMFTVMFALGRQPGWIAQWKELVEDPAMRITRPRQIYQGKTSEKYKK